MMGWQQIVVIVLLAICIAWIGYRAYMFFRQMREAKNPCATCVTGCELKQLLDNKQKECSAKKEKINKKCCM